MAIEAINNTHKCGIIGSLHHRRVLVKMNVSLQQEIQITHLTCFILLQPQLRHIHI